VRIQRYNLEKLADLCVVYDFKMLALPITLLVEHYSLSFVASHTTASHCKQFEPIEVRSAYSKRNIRENPT